MKPEDFHAFFEALHGWPPFPWQSRLAKQVAQQGHWPRILHLPTASGKTATIDIAVFNLALQAEQQQRTAPLRVFFIIDRRVVVDQAFKHACRVAEEIEHAKDGILAEVKERLQRFGGEVPLHVAVMRGGMYRDDSWARSPAQPTVCVSTVDQFGSRLLFRGYGLSEYMRPLHAGLCGCDSLIILDEAHLSEPFLRSLNAVERYRQWAERPLSTPFQTVHMSATPRPGEGAFTLDDADRTHEVLSMRLDASKPARLIELPRHSADEESNRDAFASTISAEAIGLAQGSGGGTQSRQKRTQAELPQVIGCVVNSVDTARRVYYHLHKHVQQNGTGEVILLTGRARPYDRDRLYAEYAPYIEARANRTPPRSAPLFVVATQTIEVGADIDFDALVTEIASLDALRQRFGRLNRLGRPIQAQAVVIARRDQLGTNDVDPVYEMSFAPIWRWLQKHRMGRGHRATVEMGISGFKMPEDPAQLEQMTAPRKRAPVMLPAHVDLWVQTSPAPGPDPDVSLFLHGPESTPADVQVIWRADLRGELKPEEVDDYINAVTLVPPSIIEALPVPIYAARAWLENRAAFVADVEGIRKPPEVGRTEDKREALRWDGPNSDATGLVGPREIRPGDTLIVPASYGGCDRFGWNPLNDEPVRDIADFCALRSRGRVNLRIHPAVIRSWEPDYTDPGGWQLHQAVNDLLPAVDEQDQDVRPNTDDLITLIANWPEVPVMVREILQLLRTYQCRLVDYEVQGTRAWLLTAQQRVPTSALRDWALRGVWDFTDEDDTASLTEQVPLVDHCAGVERIARQLAHHCGLPDPLVNDLALAARYHDIGKSDLRFQTLLRGGDESAAAMADVLLAKSGKIEPTNRGVYLRARRQAGCPQGWRHEVLSVNLLETNGQAISSASDSDLALYLIGSHHGRGRPFLPVVNDAQPPEVSLDFNGCLFRVTAEHLLERPLHRLDSGWTDRFWRLVHRYGYWGLAYLEAILRLADHTRSRQE